jgi:hypothetical protein
LAKYQRYLLLLLHLGKKYIISQLLFRSEVKILLHFSIFITKYFIFNVTSQMESIAHILKPLLQDNKTNVALYTNRKSDSFQSHGVPLMITKMIKVD